MEFSGNNINLVVYKDIVIMNSVTYKVLKVYSYNEEVIRMEFSIYEIKMFKGELRLINKENNSVVILNRINVDTSEKWYEYVVYKDFEVSINATFTKIKIKDEEYEILDTIVIGERTSYICDKGELRIKKDRKYGDWNKIEMSLKV